MSEFDLRQAREIEYISDILAHPRYISRLGLSDKRWRSLLQATQ
jgi:hypothetical protein